MELWGSDGLGQWTLLRRVAAFLMPLVTCGMEIAVPRYVAMRSTVEQGLPVIAFFFGAHVVVLCMLGIMSLLFGMFPAAIAQIAFGNSEYQSLAFALLLWLCALGLYIPSYAYLRGRLQIMQANLLHVVAFGVSPLLAFSLLVDSPAWTVTGMAGFVASLAMLSGLVIWHGQRAKMADVLRAARTLCIYGAHRMYAALGLMLLGLLPVIVTAHASDVSQAGYVAVGLLLAGAAASFVAPVAVTLLPFASTMVAAGSTKVLRAHLSRLELAMGMVTIALAGGAALLAPLVSALVLGSDIPDATRIIALAAIGAGPYAYFTCVRAIIDASTERGVVTRCVLISLLAFAIVAALGLLLDQTRIGTIAIAAYMVAQLVLALSAAVAIRRIWQAGGSSV